MNFVKISSGIVTLESVNELIPVISIFLDGFS